MTRNTRKIGIGITTIITALSLYGCSDNDDSNDVPSSPSLSAPEVIEAPEITQGEATTVSVSPEALSTADSVDSEALDVWYVEQLNDAGVMGTTTKLDSLRDSVCGLLEQDATVENISRRMDTIHSGLSEEQKGVVIASSMISRCQDTAVSVASSLVPEP